MNTSSRLPAVLAYLLPVIGWLYIYIFQRQNSAAMYHLRQAIGLCLFLGATLAGWAVLAWLLAVVPAIADYFLQPLASQAPVIGTLLDILHFLPLVGLALFTVVIAAMFFGVVAWILGLTHALSNREVPLPLFGHRASRLPIR